MEKINILIVGAGGFTGAFIVREALRRGWCVWAGVRASTSRAFLEDERIRFLVFDFDDREQMAGVLSSALPQGERWNYIVYNLGATKALTFSEFSRVNYGILRDFTAAMDQAGVVPDRFLYMSSLSVMGKGDERGYRPFTESDIPAPDTRYGASKLKAEMLLASSSLPYIIFRCTGIYGPHERDYYLMFRSIDRGIDFSVGLRRQMLTFIYVEDLARAVADALQCAPASKTYIISEPRAYTQKQFRTLAARALGRRYVLPLRAPLWILRLVCAAGGVIGRMRHRPMTLNPDKYRILKQRNWQADVSAAHRDFGFSAAVDLETGCRLSVEWYRRAGWLKSKPAQNDKDR